MKNIVIAITLFIGSTLASQAQQITARSAPFSYTYGLNKYFTAEQFKGIPELLVQRYRKDVLRDISYKRELFVTKGEFETDYDYKMRVERGIRFKYSVLRNYRRKLFYTGSLKMLTKVAKTVNDSYIYILEDMLTK